MMTRAIALLIASIALCSCATTQTQPVVILPVAECPAPPRPMLPGLDAMLPLDHPANVEALLIRDDAMRGYIHGLEATVDCYRRQIGETKWE